MLVEKTSRHGRRLVPVVGVALLAWGGLVLLRPGTVAAHGGEVHVPTGSMDQVLSAAVVALALAALVAWRRVGRRDHASRR
jgi:hypothetical protein